MKWAKQGKKIKDYATRRKVFFMGLKKKNDCSSKSSLGRENVNDDEYIVQRSHISYLQPENKSNVYVSHHHSVREMVSISSV